MILEFMIIIKLIGKVRRGGKKKPFKLVFEFNYS